ncbi:MoxR family ATPase [Myxococcota bacterium]|nr:MoxR family ATPase [Myxococcota bacterium]
MLAEGPPNEPVLSKLGAYGFEKQETVLLAALVSEDPLLLIGRSGTGKTFLLNSISEALGLEHRHYNASLISFDDLVGFPYPDDAHESVRFLETPATIWNAESVLVDEISRCKPEHQNRLFSLVHERRIQGIDLERLRYRWAAMNPSSSDSTDEEYLGSEPLDPALADRFALIVEVGDWADLSKADRRRVADPSGEGAHANDGGQLAQRLAAWRGQFEEQLKNCPGELLDYASAATTALSEAGVRLSPRRARLLARSLLAAGIVAGELSDALFHQVLAASLPHRCWGEPPSPEVVAAAHRLAWSVSLVDPRDKWVHLVQLERRLDRKAELLLNNCLDPDAGTLAVEQVLSRLRADRAAAFALAAYPAAVAGHLPVGTEAVADLGSIAQKLLDVDEVLAWTSVQNSNHPELAKVDPVLDALQGARRERARQLLYGCIVEKWEIKNPKKLEEEFDRCVNVFARVVPS